MTGLVKSLDPRSEAERVFYTIVDDFAQSLDPASRAGFYKALTELIVDSLQREGDGFGAGPELRSSQHIQ